MTRPKAPCRREGDPPGIPVAPPPPTPVASATDDGMYPPTELAKRIGASVVSTAVPSIRTGTLTFRHWYFSSTGAATYVIALWKRYSTSWSAPSASVIVVVRVVYASLSKVSASGDATPAAPEPPDDAPVPLDACAVSAMPPAAATPAVAPIPMTTLLRLTALCFTVDSPRLLRLP